MAPLDFIVRRLLWGDEIDQAQDRNGPHFAGRRAMSDTVFHVKWMRP